MRTFGTYIVSAHDFFIRHNLTITEWTAIRQHWERTSPTHSQVSLIHLINHYTDKGWKAFDPADPYWNIPAYSNSHLGTIRNQLLNRTERPSRSIFVFGTAFHELLLQPETVADIRDYYLPISKLKTIYQMRDAATANGTIQTIQQSTSIESIITWTDATTGLPCKAKIDAIINKLNGDNSTIFDLKTTSCNSQEAFENACNQYDYWRQMAFYMDGAQADSVVLMGVQKRKPYHLFFVTAKPNDSRILQARARYQFILQKAVQLGIEP